MANLNETTKRETTIAVQRFEARLAARLAAKRARRHAQRAQSILRDAQLCDMDAMEARARRMFG